LLLLELAIVQPLMVLVIRSPVALLCCCPEIFVSDFGMLLLWLGSLLLGLSTDPRQHRVNLTL